MKKIFKILFKKWYLVLGVAIAILAQVYLQLQLPDKMSDIQNLIVSNYDGDRISQIWKEGGIMFLYAAGVFLFAAFQNFFGAYLASYVAKNLRDEMFKKVNSLSLSDYNRFGTGTLITRTTNDIEQIRDFLTMSIRTVIMSPAYIIIALVLIFTNDYTNPRLALVLAVAIPLCFICFGIILFAALPLFKQIQVNIDNITINVRENLTGIRVIRAYNQQKKENTKFDYVNKLATDNLIKGSKIVSLADPIMSIFFNISYVAIFALGYYLLDGVTSTDTILLSNTISGIVVVSQYSMQIMQSFIMLAAIFIMLPRANVSIKRINNVLNCTNSLVDIDESKFNKEKFDSEEKGVIEFKNVTFKYADAVAPTIEHISFKTKKGETTAIIGSTGSGKSTLINLIPRFYDPSEGEILFHNMNIKDIPLKTLRNAIGFVPQQALLFSGTIKSNMLFGNKDASDEDINNVLEIAQAKNFVSKLPDGINSFVSQSGKNFSGGQKQRLCIARALIKNPEIYVFDDSFSALDFKTDAKLRAALKNYIQDASIIIVAQRVSSIIDADNIIVLNDGVCVGQGKHIDLLKNCPIYQNIVKSQMDEKEVEKTIEMLNQIQLEGGK